MPAIFSEGERRELRRRMVDVGWDRLLSGGYRALRVEDVAREVGLAKGTFYHFFPSKDDFVCELVAENRRALAAGLDELRSGGELDAERVRGWMREVWHSERLLFRCIGVEDYRRIRCALPADAQLGPEVGSGLVGGILGDAASRDAASDPALAMTLQRIIAMALMSRDDFDPDALERAVDVLIDVTVDVLFGTRPGTPGPGAVAATPRQA